MQESAKTIDRIYWLDVARVVAIVSISLNHAVNRAYMHLYGGQREIYRDTGFAANLFKTVCLIFSKLGVPLFLMISGALLLKKKIDDWADVRRFYRHNLLSLLCTAEIWYVIMYWFILLVTPGREALHAGTAASLLWGMVKTVCFVDQLTMGSMWYIPMTLCLYLLIPLITLVLRRVPLRAFLLPGLGLV